MSDKVYKNLQQSGCQPPLQAEPETIPWFFSERARLLRFILTGGLAGVLQLGLMEGFIHIGWHPILANFVAFFLAAQFNFLLSSTFTWSDRQPQGEKTLLRRWLTFHGSITGTMLLNQSVFMLARLALPELPASLLGIGCAAMANFLLLNRFVFRSTSRTLSQTWHKVGLENKGNDGIMGTPNVIVETLFRKENVMAVQKVAQATQENTLLTSAQPVQPVYSVVAPVFNEEETLPHFYKQVIEAMEQLGEPFELVLINDGSSDRSYSIMQDLHGSDPRVRAINFSRNFGHQIAISAGLDHARGQAVIIMDADLQDPPSVIADMATRWKNGAEVVYAQRAHRAGETRFKLFTASAFYRLIRRITSVNIPQNTGDFRLLDRNVVDVLVKMREQHRFMRGLSAWVGFRQEAVQYDRHERFAGETKYPLRKMIRFSLDAITSFSHVPLELATTCGFFLAGISLVGIVVAAILRIFTDAIVGQASTLILVLFLGGIQLIFLGIIGEYLGRIYDEVRARPLYIVREILE